MKVPDWTDLVKLGRHKEMAPYDDDWYYTRAGTGWRHQVFHVMQAGLHVRCMPQLVEHFSDVILID